MELPETSSVAALLLARTKPRIGGGEDTGDFSEFTRPTAVEVSAAIARAGRLVRGVIGDFDHLAAADPDLFESVLDLIALRAAAEVERSLNPSAARQNDSVARELAQQFDADMRRIETAVSETGSGGSSIAGDGVMPAASGLEDAPTAVELDRW